MFVLFALQLAKIPYAYAFVFADLNQLPEVSIHVPNPDIDKPALRLPSWDLITHDNDDLQLLQRVMECDEIEDAWDDFNTLMEHHILATISECIKISNPRTRSTNSTKFVRRTNEICSFRTAPWEIYTLVSPLLSPLMKTC
jgi:hypothetical protein